MKIEDYLKYRVQGGDIYVLPINVFKELFDELLNFQNENQKYKEIFEKIKSLLNDYELQDNEIIKLYCEEIKSCLKEVE